MRLAINICISWQDISTKGCFTEYLLVNTRTFLLKGGSLLYAMNGLEARPTVDVDFMADRISRDRDFLAHVFQEIWALYAMRMEYRLMLTASS